MPKIKDLKEIVIKKITSDQTLQDILETDRICWKTSIVTIQDVLLDTPPPKETTEKFARAETIVNKDRAYAIALKKWGKNFIGGSGTFNPHCNEYYWTPSEGSQLFHLQENKSGCDENTFCYFLLMHKEKSYFLDQRCGGINSLSVISDHDYPPRFGSALLNIIVEGILINED